VTSSIAGQIYRAACGRKANGETRNGGDNAIRGALSSLRSVDLHHVLCVTINRAECER